MFCPSCENLMPDEDKYCGRCGMFLNEKSKLLARLSLDFAWICRRGSGGFVCGFVGWIIVFIISRMVKQDIGDALTNVFCGMISGVFLGTTGGIIEESAYKAFVGGILGCVGGALGGLLAISVAHLLQGNEKLVSLSILSTWAIGGAFIGAASGMIERSRKKILAGVVCGLLGGAIGGFLGSTFYGSIHLEYQPQSWLALRAIEGLSGGLVGAALWFSIGLVEKLYIFRRLMPAKIEEKVCEFCGKQNPLKSWYCAGCGHVLQMAAPVQKMAITPLRGIERIINSLKFMSWLFGVTGVIVTPIVFFTFLMQDAILAVTSVVFFILFSYLMVVFFRSLADIFSWIVKTSSFPKPGEKA
ncbi:MAG: hypothetical protein ABII74_09595 [Elusimicrobiota bacterium]